MSAGRYDIKHEQGASMDWTFTWRAKATPEQLAVDPSAVGAPIDLTGYTARMQIREKLTSPAPIHEFTTENGGIELGGPAGTVRVLATDEDTATWNWGRASNPQMVGIYDLELEDADGFTRRILEGRITVKREVTHG